jgi:hypothetical protein
MPGAGLRARRGACRRLLGVAKRSRRFFVSETMQHRAYGIGSGGEPPHVHVDRDRLTAKFWIDPLALARNAGCGGPDLTRIRSILEIQRDSLLEAWHDHLEA